MIFPLPKGKKDWLRYKVILFFPRWQWKYHFFIQKDVEMPFLYETRFFLASNNFFHTLLNFREVFHRARFFHSPGFFHSPFKSVFFIQECHCSLQTGREQWHIPVRNKKVSLNFNKSFTKHRILKKNSRGKKCAFLLKWRIFLMQKYPFIPARDFSFICSKIYTKIY